MPRTLAISDDELLIYQMYKKNQNIVPTLRHTGAGYYTEYRKLEHFFTNLFFQMFRERIISISEDEYVIDDKN
ncbi:hypothetical protein C7960_2156 [Methanohalophilus euhalobius]|uniref:Uncharacterized protein n=1 Tax=Methanohalophilus euhalobius TaxID=51203 RepID=A0A483E004_9EURY|nr:hypothetical protein [Methanohalophilus euhalobius]TCL12871.1 hypothetical protein C7960_2156 [Methanohalophilus euhalobius]